MGLHIYCIAPARVLPPASCPGIEGVPVAGVDAGPLMVWASSHESPPAPAVATLRAHNQVVSAAMTELVTPVPVRYGQWFSGEDAVREKVMAEADRWVGLLGRFAGRAEYGVRVESGAGEQDVHEKHAESGTEYMAALATKMARAAARRREGERIAGELERRAGGLAVDRRVTHFPDGVHLLSVAHLVAFTDAAAYHSAVEQVRQDAGDVVVRVTGPWPPWSFVDES